MDHKRRNTDDPTERRFLFVPVGTNIETLPSERRDDLGDLEFEKTIDIVPDRKRIALNTAERKKLRPLKSTLDR